MREQRGYALLSILAIVVLAGSYLFVNQLQASSRLTNERREHNARVLALAKQALIGHVAMHAGQTGKQDPGSLPCPEAPSYYGNPAQEGEAANVCSTPAVGRLPWRTLGLDRLTDAAGEPLWYVISPGWHKRNTNLDGHTVINSNSVGQLTVDGVANDAVALIIAPGAALLSNAAGCAGIRQMRSPTSANLVNYLDCDNATPGDSSFTTTGPAGSFNDQVLRISARDLIPAIEAAIAPRIEREIVPALRAVYGSNAWGSNVSAANPFYPYPAPFADPGAGASYRGSAASCSGLSAYACQGLLPAVYIGNPTGAGVCAASAATACDPNFVQWTGGTIEVSEVTIGGVVYGLGIGTYPGVNWNLSTVTCAVGTVNNGTPQQHTELVCNARVPAYAGLWSNNVRYRVRGTASNVGMAFRTFDTAGSMPGVVIETPPTATVDSAGTATVTFEARMNVAPGGFLLGNLACGLVGSLIGLECRRVEVRVPITLLGDAPVVNAKHPTLGWFARNEWYRVLYFAAARDVTTGRSSSTPDCDRSDDECLDLDGENDKRALLFLAGRSLQGTAGHTRALNDFLEDADPDSANDPNRDGGRRFETYPVVTTYNDRAIVVQVDP